MGIGSNLEGSFLVFGLAMAEELMVPLFLLVIALLFRRALRTRRTVL